ncbi:MAG TPA: hypothetical protein VJ991_13670 [Balneolales bacterium]|nr:hypothetical protein [Balneolales bacterium]
MRYGIENKVAPIVTGAGPGTSLAATLIYKHENGKVVVTDILRESAEETAHIIEKKAVR